jgi:hypothetical protein
MTSQLIHTMPRAGCSKFVLSGGVHHHQNITFSDGHLLMVVTATSDVVKLWVYDHADFIAVKVMPWSLRELGQSEIVWRSETILGDLGTITPEKLKSLNFTRI